MGINSNLNAGLALPMSVEDKYFVVKPQLNMILGGKAWITFALKYINFNLLIDLVGL